MTNPQTLQSLLTRVEGAEGGDRELDLALGLALAGWRYAEVPGCGTMLECDDGCFYYDTPSAGYPALTESLDRALALMARALPSSPGSSIWIRQHGTSAEVWLNEDDNFRSFAKSAPLALLKALLKALLSQADGTSAVQGEGGEQ